MADVDTPERTGRTRSRREKRSLDVLIRNSVDEAAARELEEAMLIEGIDGEIALLRTKIWELRDTKGADITLLLKSIDLLVKAVAARYRLSPKSRRDFAESIARVLQQASDIMAEEHSDV